MPTALETLLARLARLITTATDALEADPARATAWERTMQRLITRYSQAAYLAGQGGGAITSAAKRAIQQRVQAQLDFLRNFTLTIQNEAEWKAGWNQRAASYANGIKAPFYLGFTAMLPLPAMPTEGTQCQGNCNCVWEIDWLDQDAGDADAYWRRGDGDSCQTCVQRAAEWSPLQIRAGRLL